MAYWLFKSEPRHWSWEDQIKKGDKGEGWDGVRNHQASNNMKLMELGDIAFFYYSVNEKCIIGIIEIIKKYYQDPTDASGRFGMVKVKSLKTLNKTVSLSEIKAKPDLQEIALIKQSRLSVMPVNDESLENFIKNV